MKKQNIGSRARFLTGHPVASLLLLVALSCVLFPVKLQAQPAGASALLVLRSQAASIVEEAWPVVADSAQRPGDVWIAVEGGTAKRIVENACLEFLGRRGLRPQLSRRQDQTGERVQITVLEQLIQYRLLENGDSQREVRTVMEIRRTAGPDELVRYAGPFQRRSVDTVAIRDDGGLAELRNTEERTFVDRIMGPLLLIGGAFLVVYLFFTVRN